jgi:hypothetical protein
MGLMPVVQGKWLDQGPGWWTTWIRGYWHIQWQQNHDIIFADVSLAISFIFIQISFGWSC